MPYQKQNQEIYYSEKEIATDEPAAGSACDERVEFNYHSIWRHTTGYAHPLCQLGIHILENRQDRSEGSGLCSRGRGSFVATNK